MSFGATPVDGSGTPIPMACAVPDGTNTPLAIEGGPSVSTGGNSLVPVSIYVKDGNDLTLGTSTQTKATDATTTSWTVIQLLKGVLNALLTSIAVTVASLPLPTGASTSAKQAALGTAGTASADVLTVQGIASMTALKVDGSGVTQPVQQVAGTTGGSTPSHLLSAASNNATSLKASAGLVYGYSVSNTNASARWLKFYNKASTPAPASDTVIWAEQIPGNATVLATFPEGMTFSTGIAFAAVVNASDTDNTSVGAGDLSIDIRYK